MPSAVSEISPPKKKSPKKDSPGFLKTRKGKLLVGVGGSAIVLAVAVALVVSMVILPNLRANEFAAAATAGRGPADVAPILADIEAAAQKAEHEKAVAEFSTASAACTKVNSDLAVMIDRARVSAQTDPATMADPNLIDGINNVISQAESIEPCTPPAMAADTAAIQQQATQIKADTKPSTDAITSLLGTIGRVSQSVQDKKNAEAAAAASASAAAANPSRTIVVTDSRGYKMQMTIDMGMWVKGSDTKALEAAWKKIGGEGEVPMTSDVNQYVARNGAVVFGRISFQNLSTGFDPTDFANGSTQGGLSLQNTSVQSRIGAMAYAIAYSKGTDTRTGNYPSTTRFVTPKFEGDKWGPVRFALGISNAFTPQYPNGDPALNELEFVPSLSGGQATGDTTPIKIKNSW